MKGNATTLKQGFDKFLALAKKFFGSDFYIALQAILILLGWSLKIWVPMLCVVAALGALPLFLFRDSKPLLVPLVMFTVIIRDNRHHLNSFAPLLVIVAVLVAAMIFNLIRFKRSFKPLLPQNIKGFHLSLIALAIPFAFGGVGSPYDHPLAVLTAFALVLVIAGAYTYFTVTLRDSEDREKLPEYILKTLFATGVVITIQLIIYYAGLGDINEVLTAMSRKNIALGWAGPNNVAPMLSICVPATLYFCIKRNMFTPLFTFLALVEYVLIITTGCRGAILFTTIAMPPMILYVAVKSENKVSFILSVSVIFLVGVVLCAYYGNKVVEVLSVMLRKGLDDSNRSSLYDSAIKAFRQWPIFGAGWDYRLGGLAKNDYTPYWYHSTFFQILATMGLVGLVTFVFFYFWRYRTFLVMAKHPACLALLAGHALFDAYGMIDTNFFGPTFFIILLVMTIVVEVNVPDNKCRAFAGHNPFSELASYFRYVSEKKRSAREAEQKRLEAANSSAPARPAQPANSQTGGHSEAPKVSSTPPSKHANSPSKAENSNAEPAVNEGPAVNDESANAEPSPTTDETPTQHERETPASGAPAPSDEG